MIHVPRLKDENAAELFLGFRIGTVRGCDFAVLPIQGHGSFRRLKRLSTSKMPVGAKMVGVFKSIRRARPRSCRVCLSRSIPNRCITLFFSPGRSQQHSLPRWIVHPIVVAHRKNRQQRRTIFSFQFREPPREKTALRSTPLRSGFPTHHSVAPLSPPTPENANFAKPV
jgi:hypothetical protein